MGDLIAFGPIIAVGPRSGRHFICDEHRNLVQLEPGKQPRCVQVGNLVRVQFEAPDDNMEVLTAMPGTQFYSDFEPSPNIAFGNIKGFEHEPIVAALHQMRQIVEGILLTFKARFFV